MKNEHFDLQTAQEVLKDNYEFLHQTIHSSNQNLTKATNQLFELENLLRSMLGNAKFNLNHKSEEELKEDFLNVRDSLLERTTEIIEGLEVNTRILKNCFQQLITNLVDDFSEEG